MARKLKDEAVLEKALGFLDECRDYHDKFMEEVDRRANAYHAVVERQADAAQWQSQLYPPYAMHIVETTLASLVEDRLRGKVKPRVTLESMFDPTAAERARQGAEAHQILLDWQNKHSKFTRLQRPFLLQNAIAGITVAKTYWVEEQERRRRLVAVDEPLLDDYGEPILNPFTGQPLTQASLKEETGYITTYDGPWTEVVDVHDFYWQESAPSLPKSRYVIHRIRLSREELERGFREGGPYGPDNGGWTWNQVQKRLGEATESRDESVHRWGNKDVDHNKGLLQVFEVWDQLTKEVVTIVERSALIAYRKNFPFFHEKTPFVVCTTQADLFKFVGFPQIEKVRALQEMLWNISNQRIDNLRLINNAIVIFNPALEDIDALEFAPQAMWPVENPEMVQMWSPNPVPAEISIGSEALLKGDMQNLAATFPFSSSTESQTVDQKTATGASIVSALAQRSIDMAKQPVYEAWEDILGQRLILNQQFVREALAVAIPGEDDQEKIEVIEPQILVGDYEYEIEPVPDAVMRQEEQAKAQALVQIMGQVAPIMLGLAQGGQGRMVNFEKVIEFYLKAIGIDNTEQFFVSQPSALPAQAAGGGGGPGAPGQETMGITGPGSIDPSVSPSAMVSQSPETAMQRSLALSRGGGPANVA